MTVSRGGKKNRKHGNNVKDCERYRLEGRKEKNRARRIKRHLKRHPNDLQTQRAA